MKKLYSLAVVAISILSIALLSSCANMCPMKQKCCAKKCETKCEKKADVKCDEKKADDCKKSECSK